MVIHISEMEIIFARRGIALFSMKVADIRAEMFMI